MGQGRFLNQKLGKRSTRRLDLAKSKVSSYRGSLPSARLPKKGASREFPQFSPKAPS